MEWHVMQSITYLTVLCKLMSSVWCYTSKFLNRKCAKHSDQSVSDCLGSTILNLRRQQETALSVHLRDKSCATLSAYHRIAFPVPQLTPLLSSFWALGDAINTVLGASSL